MRKYQRWREKQRENFSDLERDREFRERARGRERVSEMERVGEKERGR